jgi:5-methyltetrahydrofolate--homocysteine methyltransferase
VTAFADALAAGVLVTDGAMGTLGFARGLDGPPALWTLTRPYAVETIHRSYVDAGARLLVANTFGASRAWLPQELDVGAVNAAAIALARRAAAGRALIAGDIGPTGLGGAGKGDVEAARTVFREQAAALVVAGADALLVETMSSLEELRVAVSAANDVRGPVPVLASMTFEGDGRTRTGAGPADLAALAAELGVAAVGANCSEGPASLLDIVRDLVRLTTIPVLARPSAGLPSVSGDAASYPLGPDETADGMVQLVKAGTRIVGGCCGTSPETIRALVRRLAGAP